VSIENSTFFENEAIVSGGAIYRYGEKTTIESSTFIRNQAGSHGGAVLVNKVGSLSIENSEFFENEAIKKGGAISLWHGATHGIRRSAFKANGSNQTTGGAVAVYNSQLVLSETDLIENEALRGGAIYVEQGSTLEMQGNDFTNNTATPGYEETRHVGFLTGSTALCPLGNMFLPAQDQPDLPANCTIGPPTGAPTEAPTEAPTGAPTTAPTEAPTAAPTTEPTAEPTAAPTAAPTTALTFSPTTLFPTTGAPTTSTSAPTTTSSSDVAEYMLVDKNSDRKCVGLSQGSNCTRESGPNRDNGCNQVDLKGRMMSSFLPNHTLVWVWDLRCDLNSTLVVNPRAEDAFVNLYCPDDYAGMLTAGCPMADYDICNYVYPIFEEASKGCAYEKSDGSIHECFWNPSAAPAPMWTCKAWTTSS